MNNVVYVSNSHIERREGPLRIAQVPVESRPVIFSVHSQNITKLTPRN